jgi:hypothetical protein
MHIHGAVRAGGGVLLLCSIVCSRTECGAISLTIQAYTGPASVCIYICTYLYRKGCYASFSSGRDSLRVCFLLIEFL